MHPGLRVQMVGRKGKGTPLSCVELDPLKHALHSRSEKKQS